MTERQVVVTALAVAASCWWRVPVPWWVVAGAIAAAIRWWRPATLGVALALLASMLATRATDGLVLPDVGSVTGVATVRSDARMRFATASMILDLDGRRYLARLPSDVLDSPDDLLVGHRVWVEGRRGPATSRPSWQASQHLVGTLQVDAARRVDDGRWWWRGANAVRRRVAEGVSDWDRGDRALLTGVVLGDDREQSDVEVHRFRASGLAHLLAVSGQNLALLVAMASPLLGGLTRRPRFVALAALIVAAVCVTRADPSVVRAASMALVVGLGQLMGRRVRPVRVVAVASIACLLVDPLLVRAAGFRLSLGAVVAILVLARPVAARLPGPRWLASPLAVALAAHVGTAPQLVGWSGSISVVSPLVNVVAAPIGAALMTWGCIAAPLAGVTGGVVHWSVDVVSRVLVDLLSTIARWGATPMAPRMGSVGVGASVVVVGAALVDARRVRRALWCGGLLLLAFDLAWGAPRGEIRVGGATACVADGVGTVMLRADASSADALALIPAARLRRVPRVIVLGGGLRTSRVVAELRQVIDVGVVDAADESVVVDAVPLTPGVADRSGGGGRVSVTRPDGRWRARCEADD